MDQNERCGIQKGSECVDITSSSGRKKLEGVLEVGKLWHSRPLSRTLLSDMVADL